MANKPKILVALTCQRFVFSRTTFSLIQAALNAKGYVFDFYMEMGADIASSRNRVVQAARTRGATHLLFVDYDMYFPPDAIAKLLAADKDIIGAAYNFRKDPPQSTAVPVDEPSPTDKPYKCQALGAGLLLIKMNVFEKLKQPWFMFGYTEKGELYYGEDTYFCQRAIKECGFDVWADPTLNVKHLGEYLY